MAWIRTSLSLISFGFGIDSIVRAIQRSQEHVDPVRLSTILGLAFVALGTYAMVVAALEHRQQLRLIEAREEYLYRPRRSLALTVAIGVVGIGAAAFLGILIKSFWQ